MSNLKLPKGQVGVRPGVRSDITPKALNRWAPEVRAAGEDDSPSISIFDPIGADFFGDGVTAKRVAAALRSIGDRPVTVNINSPGGDYFEGLAIYNLLREHTSDVTCHILGVAASAASVIAMAGNTVRIARAGFVMIHNVWVISAGDRHSMREVANWLESFDETAVDIYAARTGLEKAKVAAMLDAETWIGGQAAVDQGFADDLLPSDAIDAANDDGPAAGLRAEKKFDLLARRGGLPNSEARRLLQDLKGGRPGADLTGKPGASDVSQELQELLQKAKSL